MRIGIDARLYSSAGIGRYISNLIEYLEDIDKENEYVIFVTKQGSTEYQPRNERFKKWIADFKSYSVLEQTSFLIELLRAHLDLLHTPHFNLPIFYFRPSVVTIHDLIMGQEGLGKTSDLSSPMFQFKKYGYFLNLFASVKKAKAIIVPTQNIKNELAKSFLKPNLDKIYVTPEGVDKDLGRLAPSDTKVLKTRLEEMRIKNEYFLYVGSCYSHKNLESLVVSYKEWIQKTGSRMQLVFAGKVDKFAEKLAGFVHGLKLEGNIIFVAKYTENLFVTEKDLAYLYKGANAYIMPSLSEGFSITPLEAQSFGVPILISDIPTHREVFGESAIYFNPQSNMELSEKMNMVVSDFQLRNRLIQAGYENLKKYSWEKMGKETLEVYDRILSKI